MESALPLPISCVHSDVTTAKLGHLQLYTWLQTACNQPMQPQLVGESIVMLDKA